MTAKPDDVSGDGDGFVSTKLQMFDVSEKEKSSSMEPERRLKIEF